MGAFFFLLGGCVMKRRTSILFVVTSAALALSGMPAWADSSHGFSYSDQASWRFESGQSQSPMAINSSDALPVAEEGGLKLDYPDNVISTDDNSHSIQVNNNGAAIINGRHFSLAQFHFHAPSEHTLDGKSYPLESHFVHRAQNGRLAVVGVFYVEGKENPAFDNVLKSIKKGGVNEKPGQIPVNGLLPENRSYYHYLGSLTTPPLTENVEWYVLSTPVEVSAQQVAEFKRYYDGNNRALQPRNGRALLYYAE